MFTSLMNMMAKELFSSTYYFFLSLKRGISKKDVQNGTNLNYKRTNSPGVFSPAALYGRQPLKARLKKMIMFVDRSLRDIFNSHILSFNSSGCSTIQFIQLKVTNLNFFCQKKSVLSDFFLCKTQAEYWGPRKIYYKRIRCKCTSLQLIIVERENIYISRRSLSIYAQMRIFNCRSTMSSRGNGLSVRSQFATDRL